jgi:hypothetical protein
MGKKIKCILCGETMHMGHFLPEYLDDRFPRLICRHTGCPMQNVFLSSSAAIALDKKRREAKRHKKIDQLRKGPHA